MRSAAYLEFSTPTQSIRFLDDTSSASVSEEFLAISWASRLLRDCIRRMSIFNGSTIVDDDRVIGQGIRSAYTLPSFVVGIRRDERTRLALAMTVFPMCHDSCRLPYICGDPDQRSGT
ncbi:hypothetical protein Y013_04885 [Rhodococcus pyridinivorans SB3094]|uniref:Uncharacterized protein n=1 Tax=Rhodococcus pyridinivorans SB3094 TaxID=1435356 RepID=V9XNK9_9NOCA|nr:hypothetical protein Y013_04885 [Rhodococcus pyridinivorans SB3094]